jgi:hypothetical protein
LAALERASECLHKKIGAENACEPGVHLSRALTEYVYLESLVKNDFGNSIEAAQIAEGFVRSGSPMRAIEFLLNRPKISQESGLLRLLADTLFSIRDYNNAAFAYKSWISTGCGGYSSVMRQSGWVLFVKKGEECSQIPMDLRSRLEFLKKETDGEPSNLPTKNDPPVEDYWGPSRLR